MATGREFTSYSIRYLLQDLNMLLVVLACKPNHQCLESIPAFRIIVVLLEKDIQTQVYSNKLFWSLTRNLTADRLIMSRCY